MNQKRFRANKQRKRHCSVVRDADCNAVQFIG